MFFAFGLTLGACGGGGGPTDGGGDAAAGTSGGGGTSPDATGSAGTGTTDGGAGTGAADASDVPVGDAADAPVTVDGSTEVAPDGGDAGPLGTWADLYPCGALGWGRVNAAAFFPGGASVAMAGTAVKVFDVATGAVKRTYAGLVNDATSVAVSPDGTRLAASAYLNDDRSNVPRVVVWRVSDGAVLWTRRGLGVPSVAFSPDGTLLAMGDMDKKVTLANAATGATVRTYAEHLREVGNVAFSSDGALIASTDAAATVKIWKVADLATQRTLQGTTPLRGYEAAFSPDGMQLVSAALAGRYKVSDGTAVGTTLSTGPVAFAPDGLSFVAGSVLYRASDGVALRTLGGGATGIGAVAYKPDSSTVLIAANPQVGTAKPALWAVVDGAKGIEFPGDPLPTAPPAVSFDGTRVFVGKQMYNLVTGTLLYQTTVSSATGAVFSPDGTLVAIPEANGTLTVIKAADGTIVKSISAHASPIRAIAFSPTGDTIATGSDDHLVKLWNTAGLIAIRTLGGIEGHTAAVTSVAWSADGTSLASASGGVSNNIFVWRVADGQIRKMLSADGLPLFTSDGTALRVLGFTVIRTFDLVGSAPVGILDVPGGNQALGRPVGPAGDVVAAASRTNGTELWSLPGGHPLTTLGDSLDERWAFFSPDRVVVTNSGDVRKIVSWCRGPAIPPVVGPADPGGPITTVCGTTRSFTGDFDGDNVDDCTLWPANTTTLQFHKGLGGGLVRNGAVTSDALGLCVESNTYRNVVVADANGDGRDDLVIIGGNPGGGALYPTLATLMVGREDGQFRCSGGLTTSQVTTAFANGTTPLVSDFTGDGGDDVLLVGFDPSTVPNTNLLRFTVLDGDRASLSVRPIDTATTFIVGATGSVTSVSVSDVNGDGKKDVVTNVFVRYLNGTGPGAMTVTGYGKGDGTFGTAPPPP